ncbi:MAG: bifunctional 4-hydroxy-2-oxoglutarate aldolase/2-dehydro-3-deoxy-phosphogluconate aldolase [Lentisphaerae bacterium]|nr:bifunctional 4-hydroxy-2-oxoglutarate aldolase/2-dehydro-3-deoxy-phosphogluconate aldolase [Lentisphaerota bacterium]
MLKKRIEKITDPGIIPVVRLDSGDDLYDLCESFLQGGIKSVEFTMTMPDALKHLNALKKDFQGSLAIGMGTILSSEMARSALDAGAEFLVSPVPVIDMAEVAHQYDVPVIMGAFTPHEAFTAHQYGADFVKIFPMSLTTPKYLKTICEPMPYLKLVPSGSITIGMIPELFANGASAVCVGGELVRKDLIARKAWDEHRKNVVSLLEAVRKARA